MTEYLDKVSLLQFIKDKIIAEGHSYTISQLYFEIEKRPADYIALVTLPVKGDRNG